MPALSLKSASKLAPTDSFSRLFQWSRLVIGVIFILGDRPLYAPR